MTEMIILFILLCVLVLVASVLFESVGKGPSISGIFVYFFLLIFSYLSLYGIIIVTNRVIHNYQEFVKKKGSLVEKGIDDIVAALPNRPDLALQRADTLIAEVKRLDNNQEFLVGLIESFNKNYPNVVFGSRTESSDSNISLYGNTQEKMAEKVNEFFLSQGKDDIRFVTDIRSLIEQSKNDQMSLRKTCILVHYLKNEFQRYRRRKMEQAPEVDPPKVPTQSCS